MENSPGCQEAWAGLQKAACCGVSKTCQRVSAAETTTCHPKPRYRQEESILKPEEVAPSSAILKYPSKVFSGQSQILTHHKKRWHKDFPISTHALYTKFCAKFHTHTLITDLIVYHRYLKKYWGKQLTLYRKQNIDFRITKSLRVTWFFSGA